MAGVVKRSISFPAEVFAQLEQEAADRGLPVSALVTEMVEHDLRIARGLRAAEEVLDRIGHPAAEEMAQIDALLDAHGIGR